jgi:hypothetical protein
MPSTKNVKLCSISAQRVLLPQSVRRSKKRRRAENHYAIMHIDANLFETVSLFDEGK